MKIGRDNYESYFMDYLDGKLDTAEIEILMSFLEFNPDLRRELEGLKIVHLEPLGHVFERKAALRKPVETPVRGSLIENFEDYCISSIEQQLSFQEETMLQEIIKEDPEKQNIYRLYLSTSLVADKSILYPGKSRLKRRYIDIPRVRFAMSSIAAVAIILLTLSLFFKNTDENNTITESGSKPGTKSPFSEETIRPETILPEKTSENFSPSHPAVETPETMVNTPVGPYKIRDEAFVSEVGEMRFIPEPILLARIEPIRALDLSQKDRTFAGLLAYPRRGQEFDDYTSLQEYATRQVNRNIIDPQKRNFSLWKLADSGIKRINEASDGDYSLDRETDEEGKIRRLTFESPLFGFSAPMRNSNVPR